METQVLIPQEFSLVVTASGARSSGEPLVSVWTSDRIKQGALYYPFQGTVRIDNLDIYSYIDEEDVSTIFFLIRTRACEKHFLCYTISARSNRVWRRQRINHSPMTLGTTFKKPHQEIGLLTSFSASWACSWVHVIMRAHQEINKNKGGTLIGPRKNRAHLLRRAA